MSRRDQLEQQMRTLVASHAMDQIIHALVEACYERVRMSEDTNARMVAAWQHVAKALTHAETMATELGL